MIRIYLSPSVQEKNIGVGTYGTEEKRMNLLTDELQYILKQIGYEIYRNIPTMQLKEIVEESNRVTPSLHLALHSNASKDRTARGLEIFCNKNNKEGVKIANTIYGYLSPLTPANDRGIKDGTHLYEVGQPKATAILIEVGFHDNIEDAQWIQDNVKLIAWAIMQGLEDVYRVGEYNDFYKLKYENLLKDVKAIIKIYEGR